MARDAHDREDLLQVATALGNRVELQVPGWPEPISCGFRDATGGLSLYFGQDPAYHFDHCGALRRAYVGELLFRTQGTTLAELRRLPNEKETVLARRDLSSEECAAFLSRMRQQVQLLAEHLAQEEAVVLREVAPDGPVTPRLQRALEHILSAADPLAAPLR